MRATIATKQIPNHPDYDNVRIHVTPLDKGGELFETAVYDKHGRRRGYEFTVTRADAFEAMAEVISMAALDNMY